MKKSISGLLKSKEFCLVFGLWLVALFLRCYRLDDLLGFYYDQGRDGLKVLEMLTLKDWPAIGPTTGLAGIFLGPFWFYLIAPFYFIGRGNPAVAAAFIALIDSFSIVLLYLFAKKFFNQKVALVSAGIWTFSYYLIRSARWFSNPSPVPFFAILLLWALAEWLVSKKEKQIVLVSICLAVITQLEMASAVFYYPAILAFLVLFKVNLKALFRSKWFWLATAIFVAFLIPQMVFELKNDFIMSKNVFGFFGGSVNSDTGQSWALPTIEVVRDRIQYYYQTFFSKIDPKLEAPAILAAIWLLGLVLIFAFKERKSQVLKLSFVFFLCPLVFLFFFVGNYGNLYDYYL
ncbi:MAG: glycosyltransferase family 39 protein, partial [Patescibacteria group bacterium]